MTTALRTFLIMLAITSAILLNIVIELIRIERLLAVIAAAVQH